MKSYSFDIVPLPESISELNTEEIIFAAKDIYTSFLNAYGKFMLEVTDKFVYKSGSRRDLSVDNISTIIFGDVVNLMAADGQITEAEAKLWHELFDEEVSSGESLTLQDIDEICNDGKKKVFEHIEIISVIGSFFDYHPKLVTTYLRALCQLLTLVAYVDGPVNRAESMMLLPVIKQSIDLSNVAYH